MSNNHNYEKPERGTTDWHVPINENFDRLDRDVEIRDREENIGEYEPKNGAKFEATDSGAVYHGNGDSWVLAERTVQSLNTAEESIGRTKHLSAGGDLQALIAAEIDNGHCSFEVHQPKNGDTWSWNSPLTVDAVSIGGFELQLKEGVTVESSVEGWTITVDNSLTSGGLTPQTPRVRINGGVWISTGSDPSGWLRLKDAFASEIYPAQVRNYNNSSNDSVGVSIENHDSYSENNRIGGHYDGPIDIGIQSVPASKTGGSGTDSFHDTLLDAPHINHNTYGIVLEGRLDYSQIHKPSLFGKAPGAACFKLATERAEGTIITGAKCEAPGGDSDVTAIEGTENDPNYSYDNFYGPLFVGGKLKGAGVSTVVRNNYDSQINWIKSYGAAIEIGDASSYENRTAFSKGGLTANGRIVAQQMTLNDDWATLGHSGNETLRIDTDSNQLELQHGGTTEVKVVSGGVEYADYVPRDVTGLSVEQGRTAYHDGTGDAPEGPAFYDGSRWTSLVDGSTIT